MVHVYVVQYLGPRCGLLKEFQPSILSKSTIYYCIHVINLSVTCTGILTVRLDIFEVIAALEINVDQLIIL